MPKCAVIAFPGNNCEIESARAGMRNGFETHIFRWNQVKDLKTFDPEFIILPGGFAFEDRGRSGILASKEPIFDHLREVVQRGTIILGICNGAQMVVESGLIPAEIALAKNIRRDETGHVVGTGFFNTWVYLKPENKSSVFTRYLKPDPLYVPIAHGEGRFVSRDEAVLKQLENGELVSFRYSDKEGNVSENFPTTPNGSNFAVAAICNKEGTVMAMMPHPERFFTRFDGDAILQSVKKSIENKGIVKNVEIRDFSKTEIPEKKSLVPNGTWLEKKLIITDNENFSVKSTAKNICGKDIELEKTIGFEIQGDLSDKAIAKSGLIYNESKELLVGNDFLEKRISVYVSEFEDDEADHLADQLSLQLGKGVKVKIYKGWHFASGTAKSDIEAILKSRLLANPNSAQIFEK